MTRAWVSVAVALLLVLSPVGSLVSIGSASSGEQRAAGMDALRADAPDPTITGFSAPDSVPVGESFTVSVSATNTGGEAGAFSTISLSSPNLDASNADSQTEVIDASDHSYTGVYTSGETIHSKSGDRMTADHLLVEAGTDGDARWETGEERRLAVQFTPEETGKFVIYVRISMSDPHSRAVYTEPTDSATTDQQNYAVYRVVVDVTGTDTERTESTTQNDRFEPNDGWSDAAAVDLGRITDLRIGDEPGDLFAVQLEADERARFAARFDDSDGDLAVAVYDPNRDHIETADTSTDDEAVEFTADTDGTHYIWVYGVDDAQNAYSLDLAAEEATAETTDTDGAARESNDRYEPNDAWSDAAAVDLGTITNLEIVDGEGDLYAVELDEGDRASITAIFDHRSGNLNLKVFGPDRQELERGFTDTDDESVSFTAARTGIYYVYVYGVGDADNSYRLNLEATQRTTETQEDDRFEPNDTWREASELDIGRTENLHLRSGDGDLYEVHLAKGDRTTVTTRFDTQDGDLGLSVFTPDRQQIASADSATDDERVTFTAQESGSYYIWVDSASEESNSYSLEVRRESTETADLEPDSFEENDNYDEAAAVGPGEYELTQIGADYDVFEITVDAAERLTVSIAGADETSNLDLYLVRAGSNRQTVARSDGRGSAERVEVTPNAESTYYIIVASENDTTATAYDLDVERSGTAAEHSPDRYEPNDGRSEAPLLSQGVIKGLTVSEASEDYYVLDLAAERTVHIELASPYEAGGITLAIHGPDGDRIEQSSSSSRDQELVISPDDAGRYYLIVETDAEDQVGYRLRYEVESGALDVDEEVADFLDNFGDPDGSELSNQEYVISHVAGFESVDSNRDRIAMTGGFVTGMAYAADEFGEDIVLAPTGLVRFADQLRSNPRRTITSGVETGMTMWKILTDESLRTKVAYFVIAKKGDTIEDSNHIFESPGAKAAYASGWIKGYALLKGVFMVEGVRASARGAKNTVDTIRDVNRASKRHSASARYMWRLRTQVDRDSDPVELRKRIRADLHSPLLNSEADDDVADVREYDLQLLLGSTEQLEWRTSHAPDDMGDLVDAYYARELTTSSYYGDSIALVENVEDIPNAEGFYLLHNVEVENRRGGQVGEFDLVMIRVDQKDVDSDGDREFVKSVDVVFETTSSPWRSDEKRDTKRETLRKIVDREEIRTDIDYGLESHHFTETTRIETVGPTNDYDTQLDYDSRQLKKLCHVIGRHDLIDNFDSSACN